MSEAKKWLVAALFRPSFHSRGNPASGNRRRFNNRKKVYIPTALLFPGEIGISGSSADRLICIIQPITRDRGMHKWRIYSDSIVTSRRLVELPINEPHR